MVWWGGGGGAAFLVGYRRMGLCRPLPSPPSPSELTDRNGEAGGAPCTDLSSMCTCLVLQPL